MLLLQLHEGMTDKSFSSDICSFLQSELRLARPARPEDTLLADLGVDGMDAVELLDAFAQTFHVDMTEFQIDDYFSPEKPIGIVSLFIMFRRLCGANPGAAAELKPLKVRHLVDAAAQGRWPVNSYEE